MNGLPQGWAAALIDEVVTLKTGPFGSALHRSDYAAGGTPVVNPMHIRAGRIEPTADMRVEQATLDRLSEFKLAIGDVVMGRRGEMGRCAVVQPREAGWLCGTGSIVLRPAASLNTAFLQRFLSSPKVVAQLEGDSVGSTMLNLNQSILKALSVPLPPLAEQKRIADKLDALLARVDACRNRLDRVPAILKRFRQAVIEAACDDTDVLVDDQTRWSATALSDLLSEPLRNGRSVRNGDGLPVLRLNAIGRDGIDLRQSKSGDWSEVADVGRFLVKEGDFLISRGNGSRDLVGRGALVAACNQSIAFPDTMIRVRLNHLIVASNYLAIAWASNAIRRQIERTAKTTAGIWKISQTDLESLYLKLPSIETQRQLVTKVEALFSLADVIEARCTAARAQVERLTPALLAGAFRGELVPQDPQDEPASALLARLRRPGEPKTTSVRKSGCRAK